MSGKKTTEKGNGLVQDPASICEPLEEYDDLPLLILPKIVLFPGQSLPISSLDGLQTVDLHLAQKGLLRVGVISQIGESKKKGGSRQLSMFGTEAIITGLIRLADDQTGAVLKGTRRLVIRDINQKKSGYSGNVVIVGDRPFRRTAKFLAETKALKTLLGRVLKLNPSMSQESIAILYTTEDPAVMCDLIAPTLSISIEEKLEILSEFDLRSRMAIVMQHLSREVELLRVASRIQDEVRSDMQDNIKKNFLREQMAAIKRELGEIEGEPEEDSLAATLEALPLSRLAREAVDKELDRLAAIHPGSPEYSVSWNYLNWVKELPWESFDPKKQPKKTSLASTSRLLNRNHYGLKKVKERIVEYVAVLHHSGKVSGQILLLVGPPGVGKTSLAKSIASALSRPFVKVSLGGVKDEAEIRGHRRTYIGALPGKIIQGIKSAASVAPVLLLDEIDKIGATLASGASDLGGALLELLDTEQNVNFSDHYLSFPFDLSKVIFIATANTTDSISAPLLDRMERIDLSGYTLNEKVSIAVKHLIPGIRSELKLDEEQLDISAETVGTIINDYTREAGVRQLRRELSAIARKVVKRLVAKNRSIPISSSSLVNYLGQPRFFNEPDSRLLSPGVSIGLAYTAVGGDILFIESRRTPSSTGKGGTFSLTGSLGKVMQESAQTAHTYILAYANVLGLDRKQVEDSNIHIHFPDGATPKDGPSAGLVILCALVSLFTKKSFPGDLAMTGEITLRGKVLPVGGIKEKLVAAHRYGKKRVVIPRENWLDLEELHDEVLQELEIYPVDFMSEALVIANLLDFEKLKVTAPTPLKFQGKKSLHMPQASTELPQFLDHL